MAEATKKPRKTLSEDRKRIREVMVMLGCVRKVVDSLVFIINIPDTFIYEKID